MAENGACLSGAAYRRWRFAGCCAALAAAAGIICNRLRRGGMALVWRQRASALCVCRGSGVIGHRGVTAGFAATLLRGDRIMLPQRGYSSGLNMYGEGEHDAYRRET